ncbi:vezatin-like isoform X2 [Ptychodera flava]|uniref:vezatin-like isoform X2 n=1 Tax=Ptychodera flava TaxID=63121 RepID=UPI003969F7E9
MEASDEFDAEFDDDVVFENSPLYQHLQEVGHLDFETSPMPSSRPHPENKPMNTASNTWLDVMMITAVALKEKVIGWHGDHHGIMIEEEVNLQFLTSYTRDLCESKLLLPSDREFLDTYGPSLFHQKSTSLKSHINFIKIVTVAVLLLACIIGIIVQVNDGCTHTSVLTLALVAMLLLICLSVEAKKAGHIFKLKHMHSDNIQSLRQFLEMSQTFATIHKKSVRLIQESELIARGFLMISPKTPIARLEQSRLQGTHRQCPLLRRTVFHTARNLILALKEAASTLLESFPLSVEIDNIGNYVSSIPAEDLGPCFTPLQKQGLPVKDDNPDANDSVISEATDNYSLAALKAMSNLLSDQRSEFIRRLALCFCTEAYGDVMHWTESDLFKSFRKLICEPSTVTESNLAALQKSYNFHRVGIFEKDDKRGNVTDIREPSLPTCGVITAVHSIEMHLQAALKRSRELQERLESYKDIDAIKTDEENLSADLTQLLRDLDACRECWEEGSSRLQRLLGSSSDQDPASSQARDSSELDTADGTLDREPIPLFGLPEPEIEFDDQIFEAYTDPNEADETDWDYEPLTVEEKEQRKKQREESVRMLKELRNVLAVRTSERERLKQKKLAEKMGTQNPGSDGESEVTHDDGKEGKDFDISACDDKNSGSLIKQETNFQRTDVDEPMCEREINSAATAPLSEPNQSDMSVLGQESEKELDKGMVSRESVAEKSVCVGLTKDSTDGHPERVTDMQQDGPGDMQLDEVSDVMLQGAEAEQLDGISADIQSEGITDVQPEGITDIQSEGITDIQSEGVSDMQLAGSSNVQSDCDTTDSSESNEPAPLPLVIDRDRLMAKLAKNSTGFNFASGIAAQAVARSRNLNLCVQTFGDSDDEVEEEFLEG